MPPAGLWIRSISVSPSQAFSSQASGGRSAVIPAATSASSACSACSGRTKKSTSCSVGGPPRAQAARPPPSMYGAPASRSAAAARFIDSSSSGKFSAGVYAIVRPLYPRSRL